MRRSLSWLAVLARCLGSLSLSWLFQPRGGLEDRSRFEVVGSQLLDHENDFSTLEFLGLPQVGSCHVLWGHDAYVIALLLRVSVSPDEMRYSRVGSGGSARRLCLHNSTTGTCFADA